MASEVLESSTVHQQDVRPPEQPFNDVNTSISTLSSSSAAGQQDVTIPAQTSTGASTLASTALVPSIGGKKGVAPPDRDPCLFFRPPPEIRNRIYRYVFRSHTGYIISNYKETLKHGSLVVDVTEPCKTFVSTEKPDRITVDLLRTNKKIYNEAKYFLCGENTLVMPRIDYLVSMYDTDAEPVVMQHRAWLSMVEKIWMPVRLTDNYGLSLSDALNNLVEVRVGVCSTNLPAFGKTIERRSVSNADSAGRLKQATGQFSLDWGEFEQNFVCDGSMVGNTYVPKMRLSPKVRRELNCLEAVRKQWDKYWTSIEWTIRVDTGAGAMGTRFQANWPWADDGLKESASRLVERLHKAFGGKLIVDGELIWENGVLVKPPFLDKQTLVCPPGARALIADLDFPYEEDECSGYDPSEFYEYSYPREYRDPFEDFLPHYLFQVDDTPNEDNEDNDEDDGEYNEDCERESGDEKDDAAWKNDEAARATSEEYDYGKFYPENYEVGAPGDSGSEHGSDTSEEFYVRYHLVEPEVDYTVPTYDEPYEDFSDEANVDENHGYGDEYDGNCDEENFDPYDDDDDEF